MKKSRSIRQRGRDILRSTKTHSEEAEAFANLVAQYGHEEEINNLLGDEVDVWIEETKACPGCGEEYPQIFIAPDPVWDFYVPLLFRKHRICLTCFRILIDRKDRGAFEKAHGKVSMGFGIPLPDGGFAELSEMTLAEKAKFFNWAASSGHWNWLDERNNKAAD
jgi:hypothetical protein